jgi:hypothetical protein
MVEGEGSVKWLYPGADKVAAGASPDPSSDMESELQTDQSVQGSEVRFHNHWLVLKLLSTVQYRGSVPVRSVADPEDFWPDPDPTSLKTGSRIRILLHKPVNFETTFCNKKFLLKNSR